MPNKTEARARLMLALPHMHAAAEHAKKHGEVKLGILCVMTEDIRSVEALFNCEEFLADLETLLDPPKPATECEPEFWPIPHWLKTK